jgi:4-amino-4-deoxy-L-arabinose transferase-like glycosyltransferase
MVLPLGAMGLFLLLDRGWRNLLRSAWWMRPFTALIVVAAVAAPWYVWVGLRTDWEWPRQFFLEFNLRPFRQPILGHGEASSLHRALTGLVSILYYFYHVPAILVGFFPWSVLLGPTLADTIQRIRRRDAWRDGCLLASCWFGVWFVFWSLCKTKLPHYLLPAYPALALLTACFVDRWLAEPASVGRWPLRNAWVSMILTGVGLMIALPIVASIYLPGEGGMGLVGLILVLGGGWCWWKTAHDRHQGAAVGLIVTSVVFLTAVFGFAALRVDRHQNARPMMAAIRAERGNTARVPIATYRFFRESTGFSADHGPSDPVAICDNPDQLRRFLAESERGYVITTNEYKRELD